MNKIYKVVWSKVRNCYVVVSELAKRNGKCSSSLNKKIIAAFLAAGMTMAATVSVEASAVGVNSGNGTLVRVGTGSGANYVAVGDNAVATGSYAVAVGNAATTGRKATQAEAQIGAYNTLQATIKADAAFAGVTAVQNATNYAALVSALNSVGTAVANSYVTQLQTRVTTLQNQAPSSTNAIAVGNNATAGGTSAIAMGNAATALKMDGTAANYAIALGDNAKAQSVNTVAIGTNARSVGDSAIAVGQGAMALTRARVANTDIIGEAPGAIAIGGNAWALTPYSVVIGSGNSGQQGIGGRVYLMDTPEQGGYSISIGKNASNFGTGYTNNENAYYANTKYSTAIGYAAHTHAANATAIGTSTDATGERSFAFGTGSTNTDYMHGGSRAGGQGSIVIGDQATTYRYAKREHVGTPEKNDTGADILVNDSMAMGTGSWVQSRNAVALGGGMSYTWHQYGTDAAGNVDKSIMTNMTQYYHGSSGWEDDAEGTGAHVGFNADGGVAIGGATADVAGMDNTWFPTVKADDLTLTGYTAAATIGVDAKRAVAIGSGAAIGDNAVNSVAVGARNIVTGANSTTVGQANQVAGEGSGAFGDPNYVSGNASFAFGDNNKVGKYAVASGVLQPDATTSKVFAVGDGNEIAKDSGKATTIGVFGSSNEVLGAGPSTNSTIIGNSNTVTNKLTNSLVAGNSNKNLNQVTNSQIIGNSNTEIGTNVSELVVLGNSTKATDYISSAIAIGQDTEIKASNTIAVGSSAKARGTSSVAIGNAAETASGKANALAIGASANAGEKDAIAIGASAKASKENALAVGKDQEVAAKNAGAFGVGSYVSGESSYSVGNSNNVYAKNALAMGNNITIGAGADNSIALGEQSVIDSNIKYGVALGAGSTASREEGDTGYDYSTNKTSSATSTAWQATHAAVSVGDDGNMTRQITGVAAGSKDTDAVNVAQLKQVQWNIGIDVESVGDPDNPDNPAKGTVPADHKLDVATTVVGPGTNKVKLIAGEGMTLSGGHIEVNQPNDGYGIVFSTDFQKLETNHANEVSSITYKGIRTTIANSTSPAVAKVATDHRALNVENVLIREEVGGVMYDFNYRTVTSPYLNINGIADPTDPYKDTFIAKEFWSNASGTNAIAMGREADATAENALAVGHMAESTNPNTTSLGYKAHALANNAVALGTAAFSTGNRSIAVGTSSVLDETKTTSQNYQRTWAAGQGSIALGNEARAVTEDERFSGKTEIDYETNDAIAIGTRADARAMNAIALGGNMSYSDADGNVTYGKQEGNDRDFGATVGEGAKSAISIGGAYGSGELITETIDGEKVSRLDVTYEAAATYGARGIAIGTGATVANPEDFLDLKAMVDEKGADGYQQLRKEYYAARAKYTAAERDLREYEIAHPGVTDAEYNIRKSEFDAAQKALFGTDDEPGAQQKFDAKIQEKIKLELKNAESVEDAVAIGTNAKAEIEGAVALGANSRAEYLDRAGVDSKLTGYDVRTGFGYSEADANTAVWRSTAASVAVGSGINPNSAETDVTRRISSVAAGVFDTDAVNVAQLKRATNYTSDDRNVTIAQNSDGSLQLSSPFIHVNGIEEVAEKLNIASYKDAEAFQEVLQGEYDTLTDRIDTFTKEIGDENSGLVKRINDLSSKATAAETAGNDTLAKNYRALMEDAEYEKELLEGRLKLNQEAKQKLERDYGFSDNGNSTSGSNGATTVKPEIQKAYDDAVALKDQQSQALGKDSIAIGKGSVAGEKDSTAKGNQSVAIGVGNTVTGNNSVAVGSGLTVGGDNSGAFGDPSVIDGADSYSVGNNNEIGAGYHDVFALGNNIRVVESSSVFLGSNTSYVKSGDTTKGLETGYTKADVNGVTFDNFAGGKEGEIVGVVSVGGEVDGKMTTRRIQNVAPGLVTKDSTDAVNGSQLWAVADKVTNTAKLTPTTDGTVNIEPETGGSNFATAEEVRKAINESGWNVTSSTADKPQTVLIKAGSKVDLRAGTGIKIEQTVDENGTSFTFSANDMGGNTISNVGEATEDGDAVSYGQMKKEAVTDTDHRATTIRTNEKGLQEISSPYIVIHGVGDTRNIEKDENTWAKAGTDAAAMGYKADASGNDSIAFGSGAKALAAKSVSVGNNNEVVAGAEGGLAVGSGNTVSGTNGIAVGTNLTVGGNNSGAIGDPTVVNATNSYSVGNGNTLAAGQTDVFAFGNGITETTDNSVFLGSGATYTNGASTAGLSDYSTPTIDGTTHKFAGGKPAGVVSVGSEGQERRIQNVAAGKISPESTDAINGSQLYSAMSNVNNNVTNLGNQITNVDSRARKGIAGAAALAALHPMDFDPDDKLTFAAGMGHYRGETAAAIGAFYRADEKVMFSVGGTVGNGENMVNAGVSFSLDRTPRVTGSRTALTKEVVHLREQVARQDAQIAKQDQQIAMQGAQIAQLTALVSQLTGVPVAAPAVPQIQAQSPLFPDNLDNKWAYDVIEDLEQRGYFTGYAGRELTRDEFAAALDRAMAGGAKLDERLIKEFEPELSHVRVAHVEGKGNYEGEWYERPRASHDKYEDRHEIPKKPSRVQEKKVTSKS